jgi:hypothetical protein
MEIIQTAILKKFQNEIIVALALILISAGIGYNVAHENTYNPYESKVVEIDGRMQEVLLNPTENNLANMQTDIFYIYDPWGDRQVAGGQKDNFIDYLESCNQVIISLSQTGEADTSKMIALKNKLI